MPLVLRTLVAFLALLSTTITGYDYRLYLPQMGGVNQIYAPLSAGDINHDGLTDIVFVDALETVDGAPQSGAVYVYYGKASQDYSSYDLKITGAPASQLGSFAQFSDINGDGYDDLLLGAKKASDPGTPGAPVNTCGAVYVVLGRPSFPSKENGIANLYNGCIYGPTADAEYGSWTAFNNGDANGDGINDFLVGASGNDKHEVYLILGRSDITLTSPPFTDHMSTGNPYSVRFFPATTASRQIGVMGSLAFCDIDSDGKDDILIADKSYKKDGLDLGAVFVKYGSASFPVSPAAGISIGLDSALIEARFLGAQNGEGLGSFIQAADLDGDGLRDLVFGASTTLNSSSAGKTYLIKNRGSRLLGNINLATSSNYDARFAGADSRDNLGIFVNASDINGDGRAELFLGAKRPKTGGSAIRGRLYLVDGAAAFANKEAALSDAANYLAHFEENCPEESTTIPEIVYNFYGGIAGDVNGDGNKELYLFDGSTYGGHTFILLNQKPTVALTSPNGGETLTGGAVNQITWTAAAVGKFPLLSNPVSLYYSTDGGTNYTLIAADQPNSGTYAWTVPAISNTTARVKVVAKNAIKVPGTAASAANFSITSPNPLVSIIAPNGGDIWPSGSLQQIKWSVDGEAAGLAPNPISIHLSLDSGVNYGTRIAEGLANTGTYDWTVPSGLDKGTARIKITALNTLGGSGTGTSIRDFAITTVTGGGDVRVTDIKSGPSPFSPGATTGMGAKAVSSAQIDYILSSTANASVYIFDSTGNLKWKQDYTAGVNGAHVGMNSVAWDGADSGGSILPNGVYIIKIVAGGKVIGTDKIMIIK